MFVDKTVNHFTYFGYDFSWETTRCTISETGRICISALSHEHKTFYLYNTEMPEHGIRSLQKQQPVAV